MKCANCPLFSSWSNESDKGELCGLFGDAWDNSFQYEDKEGAVIGCYVDRHFIERRDREYMEYLEQMVKAYEEDEMMEDEDADEIF